MKTNHRVILEEAIKTCREAQSRDELRAGFERAADDPDLIELAEWGMDDCAKVTLSITYDKTT